MSTPGSADPRRYRGAVIGAGGTAQQSHLPAFLEAPSVRPRIAIVALVDDALPPDVEPADGIPLLSHREQLAGTSGVDFIDICTPTATHLDLTLWGLERGYHVLCEKPVAVTRAEADRIAAAAGAGGAGGAGGRLVMPCHQYRFNPAWTTLKQWLEEGAIGRWHLAEFSVYRLMADPGRKAGGRGGRGIPWRATSAAARGGVLLDHGTHCIYQLLDIAGVPAAVSAWTGRLRHRDYEVEDTASLHFEYPERLVTMFFTWAARQRDNRIRFIGDAGSIEWRGGELRLDRGGGGRVERLDFSAELDKSAYRRWFAGLFESFVAALDHGAAPDPYLEDIRRVATVVEHAYEAARTGCTVAIPDGV